MHHRKYELYEEENARISENFMSHEMKTYDDHIFQEKLWQNNTRLTNQDERGN